MTKLRRPLPWLAVAVTMSATVLDGAPAAASEMIDRSAAVLGGLDKTTARVSTIEVAVGQTATFGTLLITVRACREAAPIDPPEAAGFLEIKDDKPDEGSEQLFSGWMFASSPALSALEHPVYDVWVTACRDTKPEAKPGTPPEAKAADNPTPPPDAPAKATPPTKLSPPVGGRAESRP